MSETSTYELLERLSNLLRAEEREAGLREKLQPAQLSALLYLSRCNRFSNTPAAVTDFLGVTKGTVSQTLMALERRGLVEKFVDDADGRVVRLRLTAAGRRVVDESLPPPGFRTATAGAPADLEAALRGLLTAWLRARNGRSFGVCGSCRHLQRRQAGFRCGLIGEPLERAETDKICREHEAAA